MEATLCSRKIAYDDVWVLLPWCITLLLGAWVWEAWNNIMVFCLYFKEIDWRPCINLLGHLSHRERKILFFLIHSLIFTNSLCLIRKLNKVLDLRLKWNCWCHEHSNIMLKGGKYWRGRKSAIQCVDEREKFHGTGKTWWCFVMEECSQELCYVGSHLYIT